jgi:hypothetical protein
VLLLLLLWLFEVVGYTRDNDVCYNFRLKGRMCFRQEKKDGEE